MSETIVTEWNPAPFPASCALELPQLKKTIEIKKINARDMLEILVDISKSDILKLKPLINKRSYKQNISDLKLFLKEKLLKFLTL